MEEKVILRVISGSAKGHKLKTVNGTVTRPTADRVKESVFNIISSFISGARVLDLYSGTGNLGIEALSRGADFSLFVDKGRECILTIKENLFHTKLSEKSSIMPMDVFAALNKLSKENRKFDIIFLDPPYKLNIINYLITYILDNNLLNEGGVIVCHYVKGNFKSSDVDRLVLIKNYNYGKSEVSIFKKDNN